MKPVVVKTQVGRGALIVLFLIGPFGLAPLSQGAGHTPITEVRLSPLDHGTDPVSLVAVVPGDCNGDQIVSAPDITGVVLEILDGDGILASDTPGGSYPGNPGCDGNQDAIVDAGDVSCSILLIFSGPNSCAR